MISVYGEHNRQFATHALAVALGASQFTATTIIRQEREKLKSNIFIRATELHLSSIRDT